MRNILLVLLFVGGCIDLHAIGNSDSVGVKGMKDPFYIQLFAGVNKSANENLPWTEFSEYPWSGGTFICLGREVNPVWGWRAALRYNGNKSRNVQECESPETWGWKSVGLFVDGTMDLTDLFATRSISNTEIGIYNLKMFLGVGAAYTFDFDEVPLSYTHAYSREKSVVPAARVGLTLTYNVAPNWRLGAELSHNVFADNFNGVKADAPIDMRTNFKVGVMYLIDMNVRKKAKKVAEPNSPIKYDTRLRVVPELPFVMPKPEGQKVRSLAGRAFLDFPVNETVIYPAYRRNTSELARIKATIDSVLFDKSIEVKSIILHGYASPESPYSNNTRLAKGRTESLKNYIYGKFNIVKSKFKIEYTPEDWKNLRDFIANGGRRKVKGDIWYDNDALLETPEMPEVIFRYRDELLGVIDKDMDADEKEVLLKQVGEGQPYQWLHEHVYPGLRHTDYIIEYVVREFPVEVSRKLIYTHPEGLSLNEMYLVAQSYPVGSDDWLDAMLIAAKQYPEDATANLNAACACVKVKRLTDAKRYLEKAGVSKQARYMDDIIRAMEGSVNWKLENGKVVVEE